MDFFEEAASQDLPVAAEPDIAIAKSKQVI